MKLFTCTAAVTALIAFAASPAFAQGQPDDGTSADDGPSMGHQQADRTPSAGKGRKLAAPGRYCKAASKKRVNGQKGTAFSACVKAQSQLRKGATDSPRRACKGASKKRVKGQKGTAFSTCVKAGAKLLKDRKAQEKLAEQHGERGEESGEDTDEPGVESAEDSDEAAEEWNGESESDDDTDERSQGLVEYTDEADGDDRDFAPLAQEGDE